MFTTQEFFNQIKAASGFSGTQAEFNSFFADIFTPIQEMIDLQAELKKTRLSGLHFFQHQRSRR